MGTKNEFKDTEIGRIPEEWEIVRLEEISDELFYGLTAKATDADTGLKMLRTTDIKEYSVDWKTLPFCEITEKRNNLAKYLLRKGDLIVARAGTVGVSVLVDRDFDNVIFGSYLIKVKLKPAVHAKFVHYSFQSPIYWKHLQKAQGSTLKNINLSLLKSLKIPLPPLPEQRKIAEILSTVDEAIQKVDEAIAKTERLKRGLMKLLTKGIGHKEFKDSEIGRIPKEWEVVKLQDIVSEIKNGFASGKRDENGIVQIRMNNVTTDGRLTFDSYIKVPPPENLEKWILKPGDLLFNNTNSYDLVGKSAIFETAPFPCTFSNHFTRIRFKEGVVPKIILWHFLMLWRRGYFKSVAIRHVGQSAVHTQYLLRLKIPLPPLPEQRKIAEILSTVDKKSELERKRKEKLEHIRRGLMNDLLTGKRRIKL